MDSLFINKPSFYGEIINLIDMIKYDKCDTTETNYVDEIRSKMVNILTLEKLGFLRENDIDKLNYIKNEYDNFMKKIKN